MKYLKGKGMTNTRPVRKDLIQRMLTVAVLMLCAATVFGQAAPTKPKPKPATTQSNKPAPKPAAAPAKPACGTTIKDYDGNTYRTVQIGRQCWMAENLRTKHYSDGAYISSGNGTSETTAYWYYSDGNSGNASRYGLLYNWKAVMRNASSSSSNPSGVQGICPKGWHVPSDAEWTQLENYVGSQPKYRCNDDMDNIAKALASTSEWKSDTYPCAVGNDPNSNNATGFNAVPAGFCNSAGDGNFGYSAAFWSATQYGSSNAYYRILSSNSAHVYRNNSEKYYGFSVRCLRD